MVDWKYGLWQKDKFSPSFFRKNAHLIDYENGVAEIERVCTHNAYRRRGLAKAVIQACFHRLRHHGISTAYITGMSDVAISLYGKLKYAQEVNRIY